MGIPQFYRWLSERYPPVNERITVVPEFDNLYLDLNGVIHHCSHGNSGGSLFSTLEDLWMSIFAYVRRVVSVVRPRKLVYFAVDGVAPRAKMNQQRVRRFRAAKERLEAATVNGVGSATGTATPAFDSNCITPGTEFMAELTSRLSFFAQMMLHEGGPVWKDLKIIVSGPDVPGEGEHKFLDYIRRAKAQPGYDPNTRHCVHGLDADLIILGLLTHEPHFSLLREPIDFGFQKRSEQEAQKCLSRDETFQFLHLGLLREYIRIDLFDTEDRYDSGLLRHPATGAYVREFSEADQELMGLLKRAWNFEAMIDDLVLYTYLPGNDFLPHLEFTGIAEGGLAKIFTIYREHIIDWTYKEFQKAMEQGGYPDVLEAKKRVWDEYCVSDSWAPPWLLRNCGEINWTTLLSLLRRWAEVEREEIERSLQSIDQPYNKGMRDLLPLDSRVKTRWNGGNPPKDVEEALTQFYRRKMNIPHRGQDGKISPDVQRLVHRYLEGLQWNCLYYARGPSVSWDWFFDFHYGPYILSVIEYEPLIDGSLTIQFPPSQPSTPFEQLLAVLPPASSTLLPLPLRGLMGPKSPLSNFYPDDFPIDTEGVKVSWGGIALLPFIDIQLLREQCAAALKRKPRLSPEETARNGIGTVKLMVRDPTAETPVSEVDKGYYVKTTVLRVRVIDYNHPELPDEHFPNKILPGTIETVPGFPTLSAFQLTRSYFGRGLRVFGDLEGRIPGLHLNLRSPMEPLGSDIKDAVGWFASLCVAKLVNVGYPYQHAGQPIALVSRAFYLKIVVQRGKPFLQPQENQLVIWQQKAIEQAEAQRETAVHRKGLHMDFADDPASQSVVQLLLASGLGQILKMPSEGPPVKLNEVMLLYNPVSRVMHEQKRYMFRTQQPQLVSLPWVVPHHDSSNAFLGPITIKRHRSSPIWNVNSLIKSSRTSVICIDRKSPYFGFVGHITAEVNKSPLESLLIKPHWHDNPDFIQNNIFTITDFCLPLISLGELSSICGVPPVVINQLIYSVTLRDQRNKYEIGMNLLPHKHKPFLVISSVAKQGRLINFTRLGASMVHAYLRRWPQVGAALSAALLGDATDGRRVPGGVTVLRPTDLFTTEEVAKKKLPQLVSWCKSMPFATLPFVGVKSLTLPAEGISKLEEYIDKSIIDKPAIKVKYVGTDGLWPISLTSGIPSECLITHAGMFSGVRVPLGQRVIYASWKGEAPLGATGTIVSALITPDTNELLYEVLFDDRHLGCSTLNGTVSPFRGLVVSPTSLMCEIPFKKEVKPTQLPQSPQTAEEDYAIVMPPSLSIAMQCINEERPYLTRRPLKGRSDVAELLSTLKRPSSIDVKHSNIIKPNSNIKKGYSVPVAALFQAAAKVEAKNGLPDPLKELFAKAERHEESAKKSKALKQSNNKMPPTTNNSISSSHQPRSTIVPKGIRPRPPPPAAPPQPRPPPSQVPEFRRVQPQDYPSFSAMMQRPTQPESAKTAVLFNNTMSSCPSEEEFSSGTVFPMTQSSVTSQPRKMDLREFQRQRLELLRNEASIDPLSSISCYQIANQSGTTDFLKVMARNSRANGVLSLLNSAAGTGPLSPGRPLPTRGRPLARATSGPRPEVNPPVFSTLRETNTFENFIAPVDPLYPIAQPFSFSDLQSAESLFHDFGNNPPPIETIRRRGRGRAGVNSVGTRPSSATRTLALGRGERRRRGRGSF